MAKALIRVAEITAVGLGKLDLEVVVPRRRLVDLARYGMAAKASLAASLISTAHTKLSAAAR